jgi:hypothetical protein
VKWVMKGGEVVVDKSNKVVSAISPKGEPN